MSEDFGVMQVLAIAIAAMFRDEIAEFLLFPFKLLWRGVRSLLRQHWQYVGSVDGVSPAGAEHAHAPTVTIDVTPTRVDLR